MSAMSANGHPDQAPELYEQHDALSESGNSPIIDHTAVDRKSPSPAHTLRSYKASPLASSREPFEQRDPKPSSLCYQLITTLEAHSRAVSSVKFSPDGTRIASCSADGTIRIWTLPDFVIEHTFEGHLSGVSIICWSPDSRWIASGADDKVIRLWDVQTGRAHPYPFLGHSNYVYSLAFSPKGNMLVSGSHDEAVFLWDVRAARSIRSLPAHSDPVGGIDFVHDGTLIVSCSHDGLIRMWDTGTGQCLRTIIHQDHAPVTGVKFSRNGKYILAWTLDSSIRLWDYVSGQCVKTYQGHMNEKFSIAGSFGTYFKYGKVFEAEDSEYREPPAALIVSGSEDGSIWIWDVSTKAVLQTIPEAHQGVVFGIDAHPTAEMIVSGGADGLVKVWRHEESRNTDPLAVKPVTEQHEDIANSPAAHVEHDAMEVDDPVIVKEEED